MPNQPSNLPPGVPAVRPATGYSVQDWEGKDLLKCDRCYFDTFSVPDMQTHQRMGCRPPDGEWEAERGDAAEITCDACDFRSTDPDLARNHRVLTGHHVI